MRSILPIVFCLFLFFSCEKESDTVVEEPVLVYEFQSIEYFLSGADGIKIDTILIDKAIYSNQNAAIGSFVINPPDQIETSKFVSIENYPFSLQTNNDIKISVPYLILDDKIITSDSKWKYIENKEEILPSSVLCGISGEIPAFTKLTFRTYVIRRNLSTHYVATFKEQRTGNVLEAKGKWEGIYIEGYKYVSSED